MKSLSGNWAIGENDINMDVVIENELGVEIARAGARADAELIVRSVNSHEALLEACKEAEKDTHLHGRIRINTHNKLKQAIALAEQA